MIDNRHKYCSNTLGTSTWSTMFDFEQPSDFDDLLMNLMYIHSFFYDVLKHPRDRYHFLYDAIWPYDRSKRKSTTKLLFHFVPHDIMLCTHSVSILLGLDTIQHQYFFSQDII
jgi:hypothetical protein